MQIMLGLKQHEIMSTHWKDFFRYSLQETFKNIELVYFTLEIQNFGEFSSDNENYCGGRKALNFLRHLSLKILSHICARHRATLKSIFRSACKHIEIFAAVADNNEKK